MLSPTHILHQEQCPCQRDTKTSPPPPFNTLRGLQYHHHSAWALARLAVSSFESNRSLGFTQITALGRWRYLNPLSPSTDSVKDLKYRDLTDLLSEIFFLGQLPPKIVEARWALLPPWEHGHTQPSSVVEFPERIYVNARWFRMRCSREASIRVLLHEMAHALLCRYSASRQEQGVGLGGGMMGGDSNVGLTGHGRAWQYLVKKIEERMEELLGVKGSFGGVMG